MKMLERHHKELAGHIPADVPLLPIDITGAARWFLEENEKFYWDFSEDFPVVVPPSAWTWYEFQSPKFINQEGKFEPIPVQFEAFGCMAHCIDIQEGRERDAVEKDVMRLILEDAAKDHGIKNLYIEEENDDHIQAALAAGHVAKWIVFWKVYVQRRGELFNLMVSGVYLDPDGRIIPGLRRVSMQPGIDRTVESLLFPFLFATSLLHAKNVSIDDAPAIPAKLAKKREKRGIVAIKFKTLTVHPMKKRKAPTGEIDASGSTKNAMHLCRGHFKDFREGNGLFGKHRDLYWWDLHVRGDEGIGKINKTYKVAEPEGGKP